jgi:translation elongation factor EF-1beta
LAAYGGIDIMKLLLPEDLEVDINDMNKDVNVVLHEAVKNDGCHEAKRESQT